MPATSLSGRKNTRRLAPTSMTVAHLSGTGLETIPTTSTLAAGNYATAAAATAAVITYAAVAGRAHVIHGLAYSYSAAPTGGSITITDGGAVVFSQDVIVGGQVSTHFTKGLRFGVNSAVVVTLASGAGAVVGKLAVLGKTLEA